MKIRYVNSLNYAVDLMSDKVRLREANFHKVEWDVNGVPLKMGTRVKSFTKKAISYETIIGFKGSVADRVEATRNFYEISDLDVINKTPGKLYWGNYYIECFVKDISVEKTNLPNLSVLKVIFYCPDPAWIKETTQAFNISTPEESIVSNTKRLDYAYDYDYDYTTRLNKLSITNTNYVEDDVRITIYGPVTNPAVVIGDNLYKLNCTINPGEYVTIDSVKKEITHVNRKGRRTNYFKYRDKERYIFSKVPVGTSRVSWNSDFRFDITLIEKRGEPEWK